MADWCPYCNEEVGVSVEMGDEKNGFRPIRTCAACGKPTVPAQPVAAPSAQAAPADAQPSSRPRQVLAPPRAPQAPRTADEIVAQARAQLAELEVDIPRLEADLAHARAHRKGLARMIAAYERGSKE
jgi:hypothetical protein